MEGNRKKLSKKAIKYLTESQTLTLSIISIWEVAIKQNIGKLKLAFTLEEYVRNWKKNEGIILNIDIDQIYYYQKMELYHRDPFDRMLIAQAIT